MVLTEERGFPLRCVVVVLRGVAASCRSGSYTEYHRDHYYYAIGHLVTVIVAFLPMRLARVGSSLRNLQSNASEIRTSSPSWRGEFLLEIKHHS